MKNIPQANRTCGCEISTGQTKKSLAAGHRTTANFEHCGEFKENVEKFIGNITKVKY